jgi:hypothetical protein
MSIAYCHLNIGVPKYQLLNNLGKAFGITDYIWYQLPDGGLYVGGAELALFAGKESHLVSLSPLCCQWCFIGFLTY